MAEAHLKESFQAINKVINAGKKGKSKPGSALVEKFVEQFYLGASRDFLESKPKKMLYDAAIDTYEFIQKHKDLKQHRVRAINPSWESERTILQMHTHDMPFLIDSASAVISNSGLRIYEILHPVIKIKRDKNGAITSLHTEEKDKAVAESIIHIEITYSNATKRAQLEKDIEVMLDAVTLSVEDWPHMLSRITSTIDYLNTSLLPFTTDYLAEVKDFFRWLSDNHFTFLGYGQYVQGSKKDSFDLDESEQFGLFRFNPQDKEKKHIETVLTDTIKNTKTPILIEFSKSDQPSLIHRPVHMDYIIIKQLDSKGKLKGEIRFLGLFTSSVYYQSATLIPIIRKKIDAVLKRAGFNPSSHNGKELVTILETYPRDELFQIDEEQLFEICMDVLELGKRPKVRLFVRKDRSKRFVSCIIYVPRERFNTQLREKIQDVLEEEFGGDVEDYYTQVTDSPLARLHVIVKTDASTILNKYIKQTERRLLEITNSWVDGLRETFINNLGERKGEALFHAYSSAFPDSYINRYHFGGTYCDILKIDEALNKNTLTLDLYRLHSEKGKGYQLKVFHPNTQVTLSDILPILENMGFHVIDELTFLIEPFEKKKAWIHHFHLKVDVDISAMDAKDEKSYIESVKEEFEDALFKIWHKEIEDDVLNTLIIKAGLKWREVVALRAVAKYLKQADFHYSYDYTVAALSDHPTLSKLLIKLFNTRFGLKISAAKREEKINTILTQIDKSFSTVSNVAEDRIIRQCVDTVKAILRTNFFQPDSDGNPKSYISYKIDSAKIPGLPLPHPFREIFVYSYDIEGIHLRGGKVARGGLRWSDRIEDFRTEILGLMKAQMVKNAVIVPVGSKGGFVVKYPLKDANRDERQKQGIECYKVFLKGLLDITDNIVKGKVKPPADVVRHDDNDPYLVVAADKGTATFSDIANSLSHEYEFWLDDAFASGGSQGYDHKKMGITARGAWVSVQRHFMEMGIDVQKEDFTVIGVGGMSGDVFGNGMLLSKHIRLVAAFGHSNIFIDPNPDSAISYKERLRMFKLERSTWEDYNPKLISKGGGVFDKHAKSIPISKEMKEVFDITENALSPDELINKLLQADIDLFWNGGIGTYVKATSESHDEAGDRANDTVRINGREARFKVVGEGGNLGLTQLGRIELAQHGGRLCTDFIDNSAGVDCSDHEVNIKIALGKAVEKGKITLEERNKILAEMTDEVSDLVLRDNKLQTQALTIAEMQSYSLLEAHMRQMKILENMKFLDREIEFLPEDEPLMQRHAIGQGLTRPELSVLLCYSKLFLYNELINSNVPDEPYFSNDLKLYFPTPMRKRFANEIENHELRREIVATAISNSIVNRVGGEFFFRIQEDTGVMGCDIARAYTIARDAFDVRSLWSDIEALDGKVPVEIQVEMFTDIKNLIERGTLWFLRNKAQPLHVAKAVKEFGPGIAELNNYMDKIMSDIVREAVEEKFNEYVDHGVPKPLARKIANLLALASACDIVKVAQGCKLPLRVVGEIYFTIGMRLSFGWLRICAEKLPTENYWQNLSVQTLIDNFFDQQRRLTAEVTKVSCKGNRCDITLSAWEKQNEKDLERYDKFMEDLSSHEKIDSSMLVVAAKRIEAICAI